MRALSVFVGEIYPQEIELVFLYCSRLIRSTVLVNKVVFVPESVFKEKLRYNYILIGVCIPIGRKEKEEKWQTTDVDTRLQGRERMITIVKSFDGEECVYFLKLASRR